MELLTPGISLLLWQVITLLTVTLFVTSWVTILVTNRMSSTDKIVWLLGTFVFPVVGPLLFFFKFRSLRKSPA